MDITGLMSWAPSVFVAPCNRASSDMAQNLGSPTGDGASHMLNVFSMSAACGEPVVTPSQARISGSARMENGMESVALRGSIPNGALRAGGK